MHVKELGLTKRHSSILPLPAPSEPQNKHRSPGSSWSPPGSVIGDTPVAPSIVALSVTRTLAVDRSAQDGPASPQLQAGCSLSTERWAVTDPEVESRAQPNKKALMNFMRSEDFERKGSAARNPNGSTEQTCSSSFIDALLPSRLHIRESRYTVRITSHVSSLYAYVQVCKMQTIKLNLLGPRVPAVEESAKHAVDSALPQADAANPLVYKHQPSQFRIR